MTNPSETVTLTSGTIPSTNDIEITVTLSGADLDRVKVSNLANLVDDTFLSLQTGAIADAAGNQAQSDTRQATRVTPDTTEPRLIAFDFDLNAGRVTLSFDEAVNLTTFQLDQLTLAEEMVDTTDAIDFSPYNSSVTSPLLRDVIIQFTRDELNEIKRIQVCQDNLTCYLYFPLANTLDITVRDIAGNPVSPIPFFLGRQVSNFVPDTTPPRLESFSVFDLNSGVVTLNFDETINASSIMLSAARLQDWYAVNNLDTTYSLQGGEVLSENTAFINFTLTTEDLNGVKVDTELCTDGTSCWIRFSSLLVADMAGNQVQEVATRTDISDFVDSESAQSFTPDSTPPELVSFDFDLNAGEFRFVFNEPVNPATLQGEALTIQDALTSMVSYSILSGRGPPTAPLGTTLSVAISATDLVEIKARTNLGTSIENTYLIYTSELIRDTSNIPAGIGRLPGNPVLPRTDGVDALQASNITSDVTEPRVLQFSQLDLNAGTFRVGFDEPVDIDSFESTSFHLQSTMSGGSNLTLNGGTIQYSPAVADLTEIEVEFSSTDLRDLKLITDLGTQQSDSYLFLDDGAINDVSGNPVVNISGDSAESVVTYISDSTPARLVYFSLDVDQGILHLSFDDVMLASSFRVDLVGIQSSVSGGDMYSLTGGEFTMQNGYNITVMLSSTDLNEIKALRNLAASLESTYILMTPDSITDVAGVEIIGITESNAFQAVDYIEDVTPPMLRNFTFDLGEGVLAITFSEAVDPINFRPNQIILQNTSNVDAEPTVQYTIINGTIVSTSDREVYMFYPSVQDLNNIKALLTLGTDESNTYIVIPSAAFQDLSNNAIVANNDTNALQASAFSADSTSPILRAFLFDLDSGTMTLTFSESIQINTFNFTGFVLRSSRSFMTATLYAFTGGSTDTTSGNVINFQITLGDLNNIKALTDLATSSSDTYLSVSAATYEDTSGNPGVVIGASQAIQGSFEPDTTDPQLESFDFNLGLGFLTLSFSETVDPTTLNPDAFTIQSAPAFPVDSLHLTGVTTNSTFDPVIHLFLQVADSDSIKQTPGFATAKGNTFLSFNSTAIQDMSSNNVRPFSTENAFQVNTFVMDDVRPELNSFNLDMDEGILTLLFTESVQTDGFLDPTSITLHSSVPSSAHNYTLSGGVFQMSGPLSAVPIQLTTDDLNAIKDIPAFATSLTNIFVSILENATTDVGNNFLPGVEPERAVSVDTFIPDTTPPMLVGFEIRLIEEPLQLILTFNETVNAVSLVLNSTQLNDGMGGSILGISGTVYQNSFTTVTINVSQATLTNIRNRPGLARSRLTTALSIFPGAIEDAAGNGIVGLANFVATVYNADLIPPLVANFTFDLHSETITLTFNEDVQGNNLQPSLITLLDGPGSSNQISIAASQIAVLSADTVSFTLYEDNVTAIKLDENLGISLHTTYISYAADIVCDIANNCAEEVTVAAAIPATVYIADTTSPNLTRFDLNANTQELILYFSEVVNASSLDPLQITFQNERAPYPSRDFTLTSGSVVGDNGLNVTVVLDTQDKNTMKALGNIITSASNTYISITSELVRDMAGNYVQEIRPRNALGVTNFDSDSLNPDLLSSRFDLDTGILTLNFDETVNISSLEVTELTLSSSEAQYTLTDSAPVSLTPDTVNPSSVQVQLSSTDLNEIKNQSLCSGDPMGGDCFLSYPSALVQDTAGFSVNERLISNPMSVTVDPDVTGPQLVEFRSFNFIDRTLIFVFDEPVNSSTLVPSSVILQSLFTLSASESSHRLIYGFITETDLTSVTIQLSLEDLYAIQEDATLCTGRGSCYVRLESGFISDLAGNTNQVITDTFPGFVVTDFIMDVTDPSLDSFDLDLNSGVLSLTFSEPVRSSDFNFQGVMIQSDRFITNPENYYQLSGGVTNATDGDRVVDIQLATADLNELKLRDFASNVSNTYLTLNAGSVTDTALNPVIGIPSTSALSVTNFTADTSSPVLRSFTLDINSDTLELTFDEPIMLATLSFSGFTLQSAETNATVTIQLVPGEVLNTQMDASISAVLSLSPEDIATIKLSENFATNESDTYLVIGADSVLDTAGNGIELTGPIQAQLHRPDITRPELQSFSFDVQAGVLNFTFTDIIDANTFDATAITIQSTVTATPGETVQLTSSTTTNSTDGYDLVVQLSVQDLLRIRDIPALATRRENTYLSIQAFAVDDVNGVDVLAITDGKAIQASEVFPDTIPPDFEYFDLDMDEGTLTFKLSDFILESSFQPTSITLQNSETSPSSTLTVTGGIVTRLSDGSQISLKLSDENLDQLQTTRDLGTSDNDTFVVVAAGFVSDLDNNLAAAVMSTQVRMFTADNTGPSISSFELDMNLGLLHLTLDEIISASTFNPIFVSIQGVANIDNNPSAIYQLTSESNATTFGDTRLLTIQLSETDLNNLKGNPLVAVSRGTTYLAINGSAFTDIPGNAILAIQQNVAMNTMNFTSDTNPPSLLGFDLDMNSGDIVLTFNETINVASIQLTQFTLQSTSDGMSGGILIPMDGTSMQDYAATVTIRLVEQDILELQLLNDLATTNANTHSH